MKEILLDVDTGVDDALAIVFAVAHPALHLRGITCVDGNVDLSMVVRNTLKALDMAGADAIPVAAGARRPLLEASTNASYVHGVDGLADLCLPESARVPSADAAIELARDRILDSPTPVTIVSLGPLTNTALLLSAFPDVRENLERIVFMGGSARGGNATAVAEFNVWHDPEAAAVVLGAGVPVSMYGLDVFERVTIDESCARELQASEEARHRFVGNLLLHRTRLPSGAALAYRGLLGDAGAVCAAVEPGIVTWEHRRVNVELAGLSRGQTLVDRRAVPGEDEIHGSMSAWPSADVAMNVDVGRSRGLFLDTIGFEPADQAPASCPTNPREGI